MCFFINDTPTTQIYTLSLHDALPIFVNNTTGNNNVATGFLALAGNNGNNNTAVGSSALFTNGAGVSNTADRKSTRLNSSHMSISYAVFCLKKKKKRTY